jgi:hypothetical protein
MSTSGLMRAVPRARGGAPSSRACARARRCPDDAAVVLAARLALGDADLARIRESSRPPPGRGSRSARRDRRDVARDAEHRQAIAAVGRELEREVDVVEIEVLADVAPDRRIARARGARVVLRKPELARRAQHAARFDAAQLRLLDLQAGSFAPIEAHGTFCPPPRSARRRRS